MQRYILPGCCSILMGVAPCASTFRAQCGVFYHSAMQVQSTNGPKPAYTHSQRNEALQLRCCSVGGQREGENNILGSAGGLKQIP